MTTHLLLFQPLRIPESLSNDTWRARDILGNLPGRLHGESLCCVPCGHLADPGLFGGSCEGFWITKCAKGHESRERVSRFSQLPTSAVAQAAFDEQHCIVGHRDDVQAEVAGLKRLGGAGLARAFFGEL
jgi:hypothetical protein